jgi:hypothetical protein
MAHTLSLHSCVRKESGGDGGEAPVRADVFTFLLIVFTGVWANVVLKDEKLEFGLTFLLIFNS